MPAPACASHVPPSQLELEYEYPVTSIWKSALRSLAHASASIALMKLPSQKIAVCVMHPPVHFSLSEALAVVETLRPGRTYLTHLSHGFDHGPTQERLPPTVALAHDGLQLEF